MEENVYIREIDITGKKMTYILELLLCEPIIKGKKRDRGKKKKEKSQRKSIMGWSDEMGGLEIEVDHAFGSRRTCITLTQVETILNIIFFLQNSIPGRLFQNSKLH